MAKLLVQRGRFVEIIELPIHLDALEALLAQLEHLFAVFAFAIANDGGQKITAGALFEAHHTVHHILDLLRFDGQTCCRAVRRADPCEQQAHVVVDFGDRADGGARVFGCRLLLNRDRRTETRDVVHIGFLHHIKKLTRVGAEAFDIAALAFSVDRIEGEAGLSGPRQAGDHHQFIARNIHVNGLQIVFPRPANFDEFLLWHALPLRPPALDRVPRLSLQCQLVNEK